MHSLGNTEAEGNRAPNPDSSRKAVFPALHHFLFPQQQAGSIRLHTSSVGSRKQVRSASTLNQKQLRKSDRESAGREAKPGLCSGTALFFL